MFSNNNCINTMASENFTVTWTEDPKSVGKRKQAGQYTAVSRQVTGSSNYVTWYTFEPNQSVTTNWQEEFFAYQSSTEINSGVTITGFNSASVDLGNWYQFSDETNSWTQMSAPPTGQVKAPSDSIGLYYNVPSGKSQSTTFGLQCKVAGSQEATAICADTIFSNQPVLYTPLTTLYASMGKTYTTNTVIASIGNWDTLRFAGTTANVSFNDGQSRWQLTSPAAYMMASESYSVTWAEDGKSVGKRKQAGQYTAVSRQVTGSSNYVTWYTFEPNQSVTTNWQEEFFAYQSSTEISSGVAITGFNSVSVDLGNWYQFSDNTNSWTQMSAPPTGQVQAPSDSIGLYYNVSSGLGQSTTFGLQCKVAGSQEATAICADTIFSNQPVLYTPLTTLYASMGKTYTTNTVIASIGNWDTLRFAGTTANVSFNDGQSRWELNTAFADSAVSNVQLLLLKAHSDLCAAQANIANNVLERRSITEVSSAARYTTDGIDSKQDIDFLCIGGHGYQDAQSTPNDIGGIYFAAQFGSDLNNTEAVKIEVNFITKTPVELDSYISGFTYSRQKGQSRNHYYLQDFGTLAGNMNDPRFGETIMSENLYIKTITKYPGRLFIARSKPLKIGEKTVYELAEIIDRINATGKFNLSADLKILWLTCRGL